MPIILRQTDSCVLYHTGKQTRLATREKAMPKSRRVTEGDVTYPVTVFVKKWYCARGLNRL